MDCSLPGSSVYGILQARILERVAMPSSRRSSRPRDQTHISCLLHWQVGSLPLASPGKLQILELGETSEMGHTKGTWFSWLVNLGPLPYGQGQSWGASFLFTWTVGGPSLPWDIQPGCCWNLQNTGRCLGRQNGTPAPPCWWSSQSPWLLCLRRKHYPQRRPRACSWRASAGERKPAQKGVSSFFPSLFHAPEPVATPLPSFYSTSVLPLKALQLFLLELYPINCLLLVGGHSAWVVALLGSCLLL